MIRKQAYHTDRPHTTFARIHKLYNLWKERHLFMYTRKYIVVVTFIGLFHFLVYIVMIDRTPPTHLSFSFTQSFTLLRTLRPYIPPLHPLSTIHISPAHVLLLSPPPTIPIIYLSLSFYLFSLSFSASDIYK